MKTNRTFLSKGIKYLVIALPLLFIGPMVIYNAFINNKNTWHYLVLIVGIFIAGLAMFYMYKGLQLIMKALFND